MKSRSETHEAAIERNCPVFPADKNNRPIIADHSDLSREDDRQQLVIVPSETHAAALGYAERGWPVFPCNEEKRPMVKHGFHAATVNREQIDKWWTTWPDANVATPTGAKGCGAMVVDVDDLDALPMVERFNIPDGPRVATPRPGLHIYTRANGQPIPSCSGKNDGQLSEQLQEAFGSDGVDVRADGGYIVLPPSRTADGKYQWIAPDLPLPEAPRALVEALRRKPAPKPEPPPEPPGFPVFNIDRFVSDYLGGCNVHGPESWESGRRWRIGLCPWAGNHTDQGDTRGAFIVEMPSGALSAGCHHASCNWTWRDLRERFEGPRPAVEYRGDSIGPGPSVEAEDEPEAARTLEDLHRLDIAEIAASDPPETPWQIKGWMARGNRIVLAGRAKMGKSCLLLDLAISMALGKSWLGADVIEAMRVIYVNEEQSEILARQRIHRAIKDRGLSPGEIAALSENLLYLSRNKLNMGRDFRNVKTMQDVIEKHRAGYVLIDTLKRIHACDENSSESVSAFLDGPLDDALGTTGCVILAHVRKGPVGEDDVLDALRGSGDFGAWFDSIWGYIYEGKRRKLTVSDSRWDDTSAPIFVEKDGGRLIGTSAQGEYDSAVIQSLADAREDGLLRQEILVLVKEDGNLNHDAAHKQTTRTLGGLYDQGDVSKEKDGRETRYYLKKHAPPSAETALRH